MMVILTDTSEEEDVCINDWLVKERLAQVGKMVRMNDIINFFDMRFDIESFMSIETINAESTAKVNESRHYRSQSISRNERTHKLSDVKSEDIEKKTVNSLHNVLASKKEFLQMFRNKSPNAKSLHAKSPPTKSLDKFPDTKSLDAKSSDTKSQSRKYPQNGKSETPKELVPSEKLKTSSLDRKSNFNPSTLISETNTDNEDNARQINSSRKIETQSNSEDYSFMNFSLKDSDPDENDYNDFGTFRSLYGGRGLMEPIDWSRIREENNLSHKTIATSPNNLDMSIRECKSDIENKSGSHNQKNKIPGKQYFLNMTSLEEENFLPENNIDYNDEDVSDIMETLKDNVSNRIVRVLFTPKELKTMHSVQSEDTSNSNTNIVELNDIASSRKMNQKVDRNGKVCETRAEQKIENRDSNTDSESAFSNVSNNKDNINGEMSKCNTNNSLESNTNNKVYHSSFKMLLDQIKRKKMDSMNFSSVNTSSSSSEQIQSSSYSFISSDDTISSSNDEQSKASNRMDTNTCKIDDSVKEFTSTSEELSKKLILDDAHNEFEEIRNPSSLETDSITFFNVDNTKPHQLNQSLETDFIASSNIDDTKHQLNQFDSIASPCNVDSSNDQLTAADQTLDVPNLMKQMLKIAQNIGSNSELDSDDLSFDQESLKDDKSDESKGDDKSDCMSEKGESMNDDANVTETVFAPPVYNDCDVESDESEWDAYAGSKEDFPFYIAQLPSNAND